MLWLNFQFQKVTSKKRDMSIVFCLIFICLTENNFDKPKNGIPSHLEIKENLYQGINSDPAIVK